MLRDEAGSLKVISLAEREFRSALADDLNAPKALAALNELLHYANSLLDRSRLTRRAAKLILAAIFEFDRVLGLNVQKRPKLAIPTEVQRLVKKREELRRAKRWPEADRIRKQIKRRGFVLEDTPAGPVVRPERT
jgi:cysteinyl-tRNA synthetase